MFCILLVVTKPLLGNELFNNKRSTKQNPYTSVLKILWSTLNNKHDIKIGENETKEVKLGIYNSYAINMKFGVLSRRRWPFTDYEFIAHNHDNKKKYRSL
jgi:hypothetical protein